MFGIMGIITGYVIGGLKALVRVTGRSAGRATRTAGGVPGFLEKHWVWLLGAGVIALTLAQVVFGLDTTGGGR